MVERPWAAGTWIDPFYLREGDLKVCNASKLRAQRRRFDHSFV